MAVVERKLPGVKYAKSGVADGLPFWLLFYFILPFSYVHGHLMQEREEKEKEVRLGLGVVKRKEKKRKFKL